MTVKWVIGCALLLLAVGTAEAKQSAFSLQPSAFSLQPSAFSIQPSAFSIPHSAFRIGLTFPVTPRL
jgi:hypothetical protein